MQEFKRKQYHAYKIRDTLIPPGISCYPKEIKFNRKNNMINFWFAAADKTPRYNGTTNENGSLMYLGHGIKTGKKWWDTVTSCRGPRAVDLFLADLVRII